MNITEFPAEYFIKLDGQDFLVGRLSINKMNSSYWVEIDIVTKESKKIFAHVGNLYNTADLDEAVNRSVEMLAKYVKPKN
ncbi:hypothetical protein SHI21_17250 [Bacteriovorax sp. PP10]|uniref:Uncharacterized protein n=1 Tax=Bacteriovorax antarcticus TaxID=3088717 RepID=A0ABU5VY54_9BACT|nr:hypothetical protein [Bacteriovorax sp. PP10]MEA9357982.1 hypothetical protein [Bacteriovorax sp. PP10]